MSCRNLQFLVTSSVRGCPSLQPKAQKGHAMLPAAGVCGELLLLLSMLSGLVTFLCPATAPYLVLEPMLVGQKKDKKRPGGPGPGRRPGGHRETQGAGGGAERRTRKKGGGGGGGRPKGAGTRALALLDDPAV